MCYTVKQTSDAVKLINRFKADFPEQDKLFQADIINGFSFPVLPIITHNRPNSIQLFDWGLLPNWSQDKDFRKNTLNARIESIAEKPSFKHSIHNRCLVLVDGFYEYHWLDSKGKSKQRYLMTMPDNEPFALGGLWNIWADRKTGKVLNTCTILTIEANEQMARIHNSKKRMPLILNRHEEKQWLLGGIVLLEYNSKLIIQHM